VKTKHLFPLVAGAIGWFGASPAFAQDNSPPSPQKNGQAQAAPAAPTPPATQPPAEPPGPQMVHIAQGYPPWQRGPFLGAMRLALHGGAETDVGYAKYSYDTPTFTPEDFYDFRGRFVLGAQLQHDFAQDYFFAGVAQFVVWIREQFGIYQGNADDIFAQVGKRDVWDFMVGRFMTWRVYRKGLGYDLYTLEDAGCLVRPTLEGGAFCPHTYEVNTIFLRGTPGRAAFHLYPTSWSALELVGEYGKDGTSNSLGTRGALNVTYGPISVSAAAEARGIRPAIDNSPLGPDGITRIPCEKCGVTNRSGYGGGLVFKLKPIELGANAARAKQTVYSQTNGEPDKNGAVKTTSLGGYLELDVGSLVINRGLIIGGGYNRTETNSETDEFMRHNQLAGYIAFPLGFNDAMVKLVLSQSTNRWEEPQSGVDNTFLLRNSKMVAGRVRLSFRF
jgi:hypothetical protein